MASYMSWSRVIVSAEMADDKHVSLPLHYTAGVDSSGVEVID